MKWLIKAVKSPLFDPHAQVWAGVGRAVQAVRVEQEPTRGAAVRVTAVRRRKEESRGRTNPSGPLLLLPLSDPPLSLSIRLLACSEASEWLQAITAKYRLILSNPPAGASVPPRPPRPLAQCPRQCRHTPNRHGSFAPARFPCDVKFYCNGKVDGSTQLCHAPTSLHSAWLRD